MKKIKIKLSKSEAKSLIFILRYIDIPFEGIELEATKEVFFSLAISLTKKIAGIQEKYSIALKMTDAYFIFKVFTSSPNIAGPYEIILIQKFIDAIHKQTT